MSKSRFEELYDKVAPRVGHDTFMKAYDHVNTLVGELETLVREANAWGAENGFPEAGEYPQYPRVREIGEEFHRLAGLGGMQASLRSVQKRLGDYPPATFDYSVATYGWAGIGNWQP